MRLLASGVAACCVRLGIIGAPVSGGAWRGRDNTKLFIWLLALGCATSDVRLGVLKSYAQKLDKLALPRC